MAFPATYQDIQNSVIAKLGLDSTNDLAKVKDWINQVYAEVCVQTEALQACGTATLTANQANYTMPSQILRIKSMAIQSSGQTDYGPPLRQVSQDHMIQLRQNSGSTAVSSGSSTHYAIVGLNRFELWPTPVAADTIKVYYVYLPTALSANSDVAVLQEPFSSKLLEYGALAEGADFMRDPSESEYRQLYGFWMAKFKAHLNRRSGTLTPATRIISAGGLIPHDPSTDLGD